MTTIIYTNPVSSVTVWKETKDSYKQVSLPYVIAANFGGKNLLTVDLLPFVKTGKKDATIIPFFSLVIDGNYNVSIKINNVANGKNYTDSNGNVIVNLSEAIVNHWLKGKVIPNNGYIFYTEVYLLAYAILPLIKQSVEGNLGKKLGYAIRIEKLTEYDFFNAVCSVVSVCPLTQAILSACRDKLATLTAPIVEIPLPASDNPETVDQHKALADNPETTNPAIRQDSDNGNESLPPLESFDQDIIQDNNDVINYNVLTDKFQTNPESLKQLELIELAKSLQLTASARNSKRELQNMINAALTVNA